MAFTRRVLTVLAPLAVAALAAGCTDNSATDDSGSTKDGSSAAGTTIKVESTDDACELSATTAESGNLVFRVHNGGSGVTEFYLYQADGVAIAAEVENIGPGLSRDLVLRAKAGKYVTACKPGMSGDGIRADFTVTKGKDDGTTTDADVAKLEATAVDRYHDYVKAEADQLLAGTTQFATAVKAGDDDTARSLYATVRMHWERIEPVAESFGDLDPKLDLREADLEPGQTWTGWHRLEKELWPPAGFTPVAVSERAPIADQLVTDTQDLVTRIGTLELKVDQLANGAKELLDEVATGKVTGEEEAWSHTDLWDFQANLEGAHEAFEALEPIVLVKEPKLVETLDQRFEAAQTALDAHRQGDGFVLYTDLTEAEVKALADAVDALGEPLSKLAAAVVL